MRVTARPARLGVAPEDSPSSSHEHGNRRLWPHKVEPVKAITVASVKRAARENRGRPLWPHEAEAGSAMCIAPFERHASEMLARSRHESAGLDRSEKRRNGPVRVTWHAHCRTRSGVRLSSKCPAGSRQHLFNSHSYGSSSEGVQPASASKRVVRCPARLAIGCRS
jgi:hypothetical protein